MNKIILLKLLFLITITGCKTSENKNIYQKIKYDTDNIIDSLIKIRRDFHQYPELAGKENRTSKTIANYLTNLGLEVKTGIAGNGVIGILRGNNNGKNIAWRADMDALSNNFSDEVPYKSKNHGVQHGCGHDIHMAIGLGIAEVLSKNKEFINGTIYFIFQPEEETFYGAKNIVSSKEFSELNIDEIYALHVTALPIGQIMVKPKEIFAYQKRIQITFNKKTSRKNLEELYNTLRNKTLRNGNGNPWEIEKAFDTINGLTNPNTIFKDYLFLTENFVVTEDENRFYLKANLYETNKSNLPNILPKIKQVINNTKFKDAFISASYIQENPTVDNDIDLTEEATHILNSIYGNKTVLTSYGQIPYFNDDFIYFQKNVSGVYFLLGASNPEKGIVAMNHAPNFKVDENCIKVGVKSFSALILERSNTK